MKVNEKKKEIWNAVQFIDSVFSSSKLTEIMEVFSSLQFHGRFIEAKSWIMDFPHYSNVYSPLVFIFFFERKIRSEFRKNNERSCNVKYL